jgi:hypothetical protein
VCRVGEAGETEAEHRPGRQFWHRGYRKIDIVRAHLRHRITNRVGYRCVQHVILGRVRTPAAEIEVAARCGCERNSAKRVVPKPGRRRKIEQIVRARIQGQAGDGERTAWQSPFRPLAVRPFVSRATIDRLSIASKRCCALGLPAHVIRRLRPGEGGCHATARLRSTASRKRPSIVAVGDDRLTSIRDVAQTSQMRKERSFADGPTAALIPFTAARKRKPTSSTALRNLERSGPDFPVPPAEAARVINRVSWNAFPSGTTSSERLRNAY